MHPRGNILARLPLTRKPLDYQMFGRVSGASRGLAALGPEGPSRA